MDAPQRTCKTCHKELPISDFYQRTRTVGGSTTIDTWCKVCRQIRGKEKYSTDPAHRRRRLQTNDEYSKTTVGRFTILKVSARRRGIDQSLTLQQFSSLFSLPCHYCNDALGTRAHTSGLDRKNNELGYDIDNVVPCCATCNYLRGDILTVEETEHVVACLLEFRRKS